jgi:hypothetical protein
LLECVRDEAQERSDLLGGVKIAQYTLSAPLFFHKKRRAFIDISAFFVQRGGFAVI